MNIETTILGGLPVEIRFLASPPEKEVGIYSWRIEHWEIAAIAGKICDKTPAWLYRKIEKEKGESQKIENDCLQELNEVIRKRNWGY